MCSSDLHRDAEVVALLAPALPAMRAAFTGGNSVRLGDMLTMLGLSRIATREFAAAESNLREADAVVQAADNASDDQRAEVLTSLVELYERWSAAEPDRDHGAKAAACRARLDEAQACRRQ